MDELTEFQRETLEILRQPMEEKKICIARLNASYEYPADFMLVAAMNPCKCGYYPDMQRCTCTSAAIDRYLRKVSRPLLDRIDICVEVPQVRFRDLYNTGKSEKSEEIRARVVRTQEIQKCGIGEKIFALTVISRLRRFLNIVNLTKTGNLHGTNV